jgi:proteasome accessory factor C
MARHPVEERLQRLLAALAGIAATGPVRLDELCERFGVSRRQMEADLRLAQFMGVPPYTLPGETPEVSFHDDWVDVRVPEFFARPPTLTRPEGFAVLAAGRAALALDPGIDALRSAMAKLADALALAGEIDITIEEPPFLDEVRTAIEAHRRLEIDYWSAWRDERSTRRVDPLQVKFVEGAWQLLAIDHRSGQERRFRADRILDLRDTGEVFEPPAFTPIDGPFDAPSFAEAITVRFPADARWVTEYVDLEVTDEHAESFTAVVTSVGESWLARLLLRTGGEVLDPPELTDLRRRTAATVLARYGES